MSNVGYLVEMRDRALAQGDLGQYRAIVADLTRVGYREDAGMEVAVSDDLETAVPAGKQKGGRPKLPRCEHGAIVGRCVDCEEDE